MLPVLWLALGWLAGGFLSVVAVALPKGRAPTGAAGRCPECGAAIPGALVVTRGREAERCPRCQARVREPWPLGEALAAAAFGALAWRFGWGWPLALYTALAAVLVLVVLIDVRHRLILDVVTFPAIAVAVPLGIVTVGLGRTLLGGLLAGGVFLGLYLLARVLYRQSGALGLGDVKLALLIGLVVGAPAALSAVVYSALAGGVTALALIVAGRSRTYAMPYGPSLALGALVTVLLDPSVWR